MSQPMMLPATVRRVDICNALAALLPGIDVNEVFEVHMTVDRIQVRYYKRNDSGRRFIEGDEAASDALEVLVV